MSLEDQLTKQAALLKLPELKFIKSNDDWKKFQASANDPKTAYIVTIYAEWCGPCHRATPILLAAAARLKNMVRLAFIESSYQQSVDAGTKLAYTGYPSIFLLTRDALKSADLQPQLELRALLAYDFRPETIAKRIQDEMRQ
jgi:thiol-disulfide isomerase/thioredoxin